MRLVFAGTPVFSVGALEALHTAGHDVAAVFTQPDRPAGRGQKLTPSAVAQAAGQLGIPVFKPEKLHAEAQAQLRELNPGVMVVVAYGLLLPQAVLDIPRHGCLNIHASLLPRWRGAAPIQRAIEAGDSETGVTIMRMDKGLDTGPMLLRESTPIAESTTAAQLHDVLAAMGARLIVQALAQLQNGTLPQMVQPAEGVTYARKLTKEEARVQWAQPAAEIARRIRAFNPAPGCWCELEGERVRLLDASADAGHGAPGSILASDDAGLRVACGDGAVLIRELQFAGGKPMSAAQAARGRNLGGKKFS